MTATTTEIGHSMKSLSPQFLVDDVAASTAFYRDRLGFQIDFVYDDFYASVSRDGCSIHLKEAPKTEEDRRLRKAQEHLDAYVDVEGIETLYSELQAYGAPITKPLESRPWGVKDFYVEDPDGYILCFGEAV
jgi:catechol 2,3-dioxygenase-like lactoylglutathione lyase family enzyme